MEPVQDSGYYVYVRLDKSHAAPPETQERLIKACFSYAEARRIQRLYRQSDRDCVIRYGGDTGGGD